MKRVELAPAAPDRMMKAPGRALLKFMALCAISGPASAKTALPEWFIFAVILIPISPALVAGAVGALLPKPRYGWSLLAGILLSCAASIGISVTARGDDVVFRAALYSIPAFLAHLIAYCSCRLIVTLIRRGGRQP